MRLRLLDIKIDQRRNKRVEKENIWNSLMGTVYIVNYMYTDGSINSGYWKLCDGCAQGGRSMCNE